MRFDPQKQALRRYIFEKLIEEVFLSRSIYRKTPDSRMNQGFSDKLRKSFLRFPDWLFYGWNDYLFADDWFIKLR